MKNTRGAMTTVSSIPRIAPAVACAGACLLLLACGDPAAGGNPAGSAPAATNDAGSGPTQEAPESPPVQETTDSAAEAAPDTSGTASGPSGEVVPSDEPEPPAAEPVAAAPPAAPVDGGQVYATYCALCHRAGLNAAPKHGNKILWGRVVAKGREQVYHNALNGIRAMPPRGGIATLSDEEVKAGTDYMVMGSGGWRGAE